MLDFTSAFKRPLSSWKRFSLQGVLSIFPWSYIAFPLTWGYLFECVEASLAGEDGLPEWYNFIHIILNGLASLTVVLVYLLPGLLLVVFSYPGRNPFDQADVPFFPSLLIGLALLLLASYILAAAIVVAAADGDWKFAFYLNKVLSAAFTKDYLTAAASSLLLALAVFGILFWVGSWTLLPAWFGVPFRSILGGVLAAYSGIVSMTLFAQAYVPE